ncbi:hypothetical protein DV738_g1225, partial [Chaetothyriales sp. CBS 135597]
LEGESDAVHIIEAPVKLPPCDQCRRRKVKCDGRRIPCERCTHSRLTCTRDIARKKRGPKKGSGSVIAKLRDEHEYAVLQETGLPAFDLSTLDRQVPALRRSYSNETSFSSPVLSPLAPSLSDVFAPTIETSAIPRSVPTRDSPNGTPYNTDSAPTAGFGQAGIHFPASWQVTPSDLLQFKAPTSPAGYMTVTDLAQQIFQDPFPPPAATHAQSAGHTLPQNIHSGSPKTESAPHRPPSINKVIASPTSSPGSSNGGNYLYRSDSGLVQLGPALVSLAQEVGMSAFLLWQCIKQYFRHVYAIRPFIHEPTFMARLNQSEDLSIEEKVLVLSLCAVTAVHDAPETEALSLEKKLKLGNQLLETAIQMRKSYGWIEHATVLAIQTSYLIAVALFELKKPRSHHFYLREAIGMAYDQNLHKELGYVNMSEIQAICARRTFAVLFITERGFAILRNKPASITKLPIVPTEYFDEQDRLVLAGFTAIVNLFSVLDENFVNLWRSEPGDELSSTPLDNIASLQHSLNEIEFDAYSLTPVQRADVYITHQWLRLIFWQASMRLGLVSSDATDPIFYYNYPIIVARDTCIVMKQLTPEAILVHGLGIFEKIFEITYTLMDALTIAKIAWSDSPELRKLFEVLAASPNSQNTYVKMLQSKFDVQSPDATTPGVKDQASYASPQYCSPPDESSQEQGAWKPPIWTTFEPEGKPVDYGKGDLNQRGISTDFIMADVSKPLDS